MWHKKILPYTSLSQFSALFCTYFLLLLFSTSHVSFQHDWEICVHLSVFIWGFNHRIFRVVRNPQGSSCPTCKWMSMEKEMFNPVFICFLSRKGRHNTVVFHTAKLLSYLRCYLIDVRTQHLMFCSCINYLIFCMSVFKKKKTRKEQKKRKASTKF